MGMNNERSYVEKASYTWSEDSIRLILTPSQKAKYMYLYIQEIGHFKTEPPYFTERKNLNSFLIIYTMKGKGRLKYEDKDIDLGEGSVAYIDCMKEHQYEAIAGGDWEFLWVHFNGANALGYYKEFTHTEFRVLQVQDKEELQDLFWEMIRSNQKKNVTTDIRTNTILNTIVGNLIVQNTLNDTEGLFVPQFIRDICKEIDKHFIEDIGLEELAKTVNRSKYHVAKEFKKYIGTTVNEYIIMSRISYAKELLKYSDASVGEITYRIGMNNVSHFINLFKVREHNTPLAYRNEWRTFI